MDEIRFTEDYSVTKNGEVISHKYGKRRVLKYSNNHKGYQIVNLMINGVRVGAQVHRIVAEAFIPNLENKPQVNHIDGDKNNNKVDNLEWATESENMKHSFSVLNTRASNIRPIKIIETDEEFDSIIDCASHLKVKYNMDSKEIYIQNSIYRVLSGRRKKYMDFHFTYI